MIDSYAAENVIRPFVPGRKNRLFSASVKGVQGSAILYALLGTARANGLEPYACRRHLCTDCRRRWKGSGHGHRGSVRYYPQGSGLELPGKPVVCLILTFIQQPVRRLSSYLRSVMDVPQPVTCQAIQRAAVQQKVALERSRFHSVGPHPPPPDQGYAN